MSNKEIFIIKIASHTDQVSCHVESVAYEDFDEACVQARAVMHQFLIDAEERYADKLVKTRHDYLPQLRRIDLIVFEDIFENPTTLAEVFVEKLVVQ